MSFDSRDDAHLRSFAARAQQPRNGAKGAANPGAHNPSVYGSVHPTQRVDSTYNDNKIRVINQRKTNMLVLGESFQQSGGPRW